MRGHHLTLGGTQTPKVAARLQSGQVMPQISPEQPPTPPCNGLWAAREGAWSLLPSDPGQKGQIRDEDSMSGGCAPDQSGSQASRLSPASRRAGGVGWGPGPPGYSSAQQPQGHIPFGAATPLPAPIPPPASSKAEKASPGPFCEGSLLARTELLRYRLAGDALSVDTY